MRPVYPRQSESQKEFSDRELREMARAVQSSVQQWTEDVLLERIAEPIDLWLLVASLERVEQPYAIYTAQETLERGRGDCKAMTVLATTIARLKGWRIDGWCRVGPEGQCLAHVAPIISGKIIDGRADMFDVYEGPLFGRMCSAGCEFYESLA